MNIYELSLQYAHADRAIRGAFADGLGEYQITMMEWLLLGIVSQGSAKGVSMTHIATQLQVTLPQVTALVAKLTPLKLVKQKHSTADRRSRLVEITAKGKQVFAEASESLAGNNIFTVVDKQAFDGYRAVIESLSKSA